MIVKLPYGRGEVACDVRGLAVFELKACFPKPAGEVAEKLAQALANPLASPRLACLAAGKDRAVILVPDVTRKAALPLVLPAVLGELARGGVPAQRVTLLLACGTHPPAPEPLLAEHLGPLPPGVTVVQHDAREGSQLVEVGKLADGTVVRLSRVAVEAPLLVSVFPVQHHYFAGFGGGRRWCSPAWQGTRRSSATTAGSSSFPAIRRAWPPAVSPGCFRATRWPRKSLPQRRCDRWTLRWGWCWMAAGSWLGVGAGEGGAVWREAIARVREWCEVQAGPFSKVIASAGGFPTDHTLIQAHKALDAASRFLAEGGEMLFLAEMAGGAGSPAMEPFLADPRPEALAAKLREGYVQYGHTTWRIVDKTRRFKIWLKSQLPTALASKLGFFPVEKPQEVLDAWRQASPRETVGLLLQGPVYPKSQELP
jgi:nickel-dependent lactate racemase